VNSTYYPADFKLGPDGKLYFITREGAVRPLTQNEIDPGVGLEGTSHPITITGRNRTGDPIEKGDVVYISGSTGQRSTIELADADSTPVTANKTIGVAAAQITHNTDGQVVVFGEVTGIDLKDYAAGDELWLSTTPGQPTNERPTDPSHFAFRIGYVEVNKKNGKMLVAPQFEGTVFGENFFAATTAAGVRTDIEAARGTDSALYLKSPNNTVWQVTIDDSGTLSSSPLP
jgi:hypothetical protein